MAGFEQPSLIHAQPCTSTSRDAGSSILADMDTQLMLRCREGDSDAASQLIRRNLPHVARFVGRIVRDEHLVEDITHDVFVRVLTAAPRYQPTAKFSTWLYRIATNAARDCLNLSRRRSRSGGDSERVTTIQDDDIPDPARAASLDELRAQVNAAIAKLPLNQRCALTLFEFEGLTYEEIAAVMDGTVESVRCLLSRARNQLRQRLNTIV